MAIATTTAIALGSLAIAGASTGMSFAQAGAQKTKQKQAEADAAKAMASARAKLQQNFALQEAINKTPYELERDAMLSLGSKQIEAGAESERGGVPTAGLVAMGQNLQQAGITTRQSAESSAITQRQIAEQSRLRDLNVQLDLGEVAGQQEIAKQAETDAAQAKAQALAGVGDMLQQGVNMMPLYLNQGRKEVQSVMPEGGLTQAGRTTSNGIGNLTYNPFMPMTTNYSTPTAQVPNAQQLNPNYYNPFNQNYYNPFGQNSSGVGF